MKIIETVKAKAKALVESVKKKIGELFGWAKEHPKEAITTIATIGVVIDKVNKFLKRRDERIHRECDFYDPREGRWSRAKRRPTGWERDEIEYRHRVLGESYNTILRDLGLRR